ncbi:MAG TPA: ADP-ribosylglycohydrolase family protein [Myxococcota bacterium]
MDLAVVEGALLGCAIGDALGLPAEGMSSTAIARRFSSPVPRYFLVGRTGFVSDDTEQTALVAEALVVAGNTADNDDVVIRHFSRQLLGWFLRLPFGIGLATIRACFKIALGLRTTGVRSAGNGAAMRAAIVGVVVGDPVRRRALSRRLARVTHTDDRAVDGACYVAEVAARLAGRRDVDVVAELRAAIDAVVAEPSLRTALERALDRAASDSSDVDAARVIGTTGFVLHTVPLVAFMVARHHSDVVEGIGRTIAVGGDTDSHAAIVGAILGAMHGATVLPPALIADLHDGPFGPRHLRALAAALTTTGPATRPRWSATAALLRNLALYPVVLAHGVRRLLPL